MTVSVITFANLGKKQNLKTSDIVPVIEVLERRGELAQVICQIEAGSSFSHTIQAIPKPLWYGMRLFEKLSGRTFSRRTLERFEDSFAAHRLEKSDITLLHGGYAFPRTTKRARELGSTTVDLAVSANIATNAALEREELARFGIDQSAGVYNQLANELGTALDFDYIIAMSEFAKETYVQQGFPAERIFVAAPDIDTVRFTPREREESEPFRVLYVADTQPLKGLHYLLDAWESLALPDAELWIAGWMFLPPELAERYEAQIKQLKNVRRFPHVPDIERLYREASALVFPSLTEGFSRVMLEAMASGLPVITTENARGIVEDGKSGFVVPIRDAEAIAEKIRYLYEHRDVAKQMGREARRAVENKKPFGEAVYEIYREILRREHKV